MTKVFKIHRLAVAAVLAALVLPLSAFADSRPDWRTGETVNVRAPRRAWDLEGTVLSVHRSGDYFALQTRRGVVQVEAKGGVKAWYGDRAYRIRDLRRGDVVGVDLRGNGRKLRAREVVVLSDRGYRNDRYRDDRYRTDPYRDDRYRNDPYGNQRRLSVLEGEVVSLSSHRNVLVVRSMRGGETRVDVRLLERRHGRDWHRSLRRGDWVALQGEWARNGVFVADSIGRGYDSWGGRR